MKINEKEAVVGPFFLKRRDKYESSIVACTYEVLVQWYFTAPVVFYATGVLRAKIK